MVRFNQTKFESGVTNSNINGAAIIILIAVCTENYLKGLKYVEIVSQMFIEKTLQVYAKHPKVVGTAANHFNDSHTFGVVLYFNLLKIHHHHDNPFSD